MHLTNFVNHTGMAQYALGCSGFTGINVSRNTEVSCNRKSAMTFCILFLASVNRARPEISSQGKPFNRVGWRSCEQGAWCPLKTNTKVMKAKNDNHDDADKLLQPKLYYR